MPWHIDSRSHAEDYTSFYAIAAIPMPPIQSASGVVSINSVTVSARSSNLPPELPSPELCPELSIIVPLYCEESNVDYLFERLEHVVNSLGANYEIVCVDDGSKDSTLLRLIDHHHRNPAIKVVALARNFGKELALTAGIDYSKGKAVVPIGRRFARPSRVYSGADGKVARRL